MLKPVPVLPATSLLAWLAVACSGSNAAPGAGDAGSGTAGTSGGSAGGAAASGSAGAGGSARGGEGGSAGQAGGSGGSGAGVAGRAGGSTGGSSAGGTGGSAAGTGGALGGAAGTAAGNGGSTGASGGASGAPGALPPLHVEGPLIKEPSGKTVVLRGIDVPDIGTLYAEGGNATAGITARVDKVLASGFSPHVIRLAVYPRTTFNGSYPFYSPVPYPVGQKAPSGMHQELTEDDYFTKLLQPAVDYVTDKKMYVIIDYHQIDDAVGQSGTDAVTFWHSVAPRFASYPNVIFEAFNEPIDTMTPWSTFKATAQSFVDAIRAGAPDNLIVVPSMSWDQKPGDAASDPPSGKNLVYTAHVYPGNWSTSFQQQVQTAAAVAPVFFTEWGYVLNGSDRNLGTADANWGPDFRATVDANGASWSAWVADGSWTPNMFTNQQLSALTPFGTFTADWLSAKATSDWVF